MALGYRTAPFLLIFFVCFVVRVHVIDILMFLHKTSPSQHIEHTGACELNEELSNDYETQTVV